MARLIAAFGLQSLRGRFTLVVMLLAGFLLVSAFLSQDFLNRRLNLAIANLAERSRAQDELQMLRRDLWSLHVLLQDMLHVRPGERGDRLEQHFARIRSGIARFMESASVPGDAAEAFQRLQGRLERLEAAARSLAVLQDRHEARYPALPALSSEMLPASRNFLSLLDRAEQHLEDEPGADGLRAELGGLRNRWLRLIAAFRLLLAGHGLEISGNTDLRRERVALVASLHDDLLAHVERFSEAAAGVLPSGLLNELRRSALVWRSGFDRIRQLEEEGRWRADLTLYQGAIEPLLSEIRLDLDLLERQLYQASIRELDRLLSASHVFSLALWARLALTLLVMLVLWLYFERAVLVPMAHIAEAMKREARGLGEEAPRLPDVRLEETMDLVEAYTEMHGQVRLRQKELEHIARHDALTGLPNRHALQRFLVRAVHQAEREGGTLALLMLDLDRFKEINDTLGHEMGDRVLQEIAPRFLRCLEPGELLARLGGDEFAIVLPGSDEHRALAVAESLRRVLDRDLEVEGYRLRVGGSIGIALYPEHGRTGAALLRRADIAMYAAKHGNEGYLIYDPEQEAMHRVHLDLENELRDAIEQDLLALHYQPIMDIAGRRVVAVEALLHWHTRSHAEVGMDEIHRLAEHTGLIKPLTLWVLNTAIRQARSWQLAGLDLAVSVNLSVWNLQDLAFFDQVAQRLEAWDLPPERLRLEITESAVMADPERAMVTMRHLARHGVRLSVDDYGTGFSSLQYLKRLPVDSIKIDKSFVMDMMSDENDAVIVRSTIDLAHNLGMKVVAEGVETRDVWDLLEILRCDLAQGFFIGHAMPAATLESWLRDGDWRDTIPPRRIGNAPRIRAI